MPASLTAPWMIIGVASTGGASVSSRRFETLDARISKQPIESSDLNVASVDNDEPVLSPFSSGVEYSINEEDEGGGTDDGEETTAGRIGSDD